MTVILDEAGAVVLDESGAVITDEAGDPYGTARQGQMPLPHAEAGDWP